MPIKSIIQIIILIIIFLILGGVYFKYFSKEKILVDETNQDTEMDVLKKSGIELNIKQNGKDSSDQDIKKNINPQSMKSNKNELINNKGSKNNIKLKLKEEKEIPNLVKNVEYLTSDKNGNKYKILASSGRTNKNNKNILDLDNVTGEITSEERSTIYIKSNFAEYNSSTSASKFYSNVVINYENKQINCENFDINMDTNIAIAYNNVVVTDPKSTMKTIKISLNIETKEININPEQNQKNKIKINTEQ